MRRLAGAAVAGVLLARAAAGQQVIAPDDPALLSKTIQLCLRAALTAGGIDKTTHAYCACVAPVFARHMTADSRYRVAALGRFDQRPEFDDPKATYAEVVKACPPAE